MLDGDFRRPERGEPRAGIAPGMERRLVVGRGQRDRRMRPHRVHRRARGGRIRPEHRPVVAVEGDDPAPRTQCSRALDECLADRRGEDGEGDAGQVDRVEAGKLVKLGSGTGEQGARRALGAPVAEEALAGRVGLDGVDARQAVGAAADEAAVDALLLPLGDHAVGEPVGADGAEKADFELTVAQQPRQIDRSVQHVTGESDARGAGGRIPARELDHALADTGDAPDPIHGSTAPRRHLSRA